MGVFLALERLAGEYEESHSLEWKPLQETGLGRKTRNVTEKLLGAQSGQF